MALSLFGGGKNGHPLADDKEAKKVLAELPADAAKALEDIRDWIESVGAADDLKAERRAEIFRLLDDTAQPHLRKILREYLATPRMPRAQELRQWDALCKFWKVLSDAYAGCLDLAATDKGAASRMKSILPLLGVRAIRACAAEMKCHYFHYSHAEAEVWQKLARAYLFLEERKLSRENVVAWPPAGSSAERELMKALMLAASSPDCLTPPEIELAEQVIAHFSAAFLLSPTHQPQVTYYWVDLAAGAPPRRVAQAPAASPGLRYFAAGDAVAKLDELVAKVAKGAVPSDVNLGGTYELAQVRAVLRHLQTYWATTPPVRKHDRYSVQHKLNVVNGITGVLGRAGNTTSPEADQVAQSVAAVLARAGAAAAAAAPAGVDVWDSENIGSGGIGAVISGQPGEWLRIGALVGLQVQGGSKSVAVGTVRRCSRKSRAQMGVGIRTFARECFPVRAGELDALLLNDGRALGQEVLMCLRSGSFDARSSLPIVFEGANHLLMPIELVQAGEDFDLARYKVMNAG